MRFIDGVAFTQLGQRGMDGLLGGGFIVPETLTVQGVKPKKAAD